MNRFILGVLFLISANVFGDQVSVKDEWKLLEMKSTESDEVSFFRKNIGVANLKDKGAFKALVYFTVNYEPKDSSGLPNKKDAEILYGFEEDVIPKVEKEAQCILVASVIKSGIKDHLFYVSNPDKFLESLSKYKSKLGNLTVSLEKVDDPDWNIYADFPEGT